MPDMDGYEVCKSLKASKQSKDIPVIFLSAKNAENDKHYGLSLGAVDYISKSFEERILNARIKNSIEKRQAEDELKNAKELYKLIVKNANDSIEGKYTYISPAIEQISHWNPKMEIGMNVYEGMHPDDLEVAINTFFKLISDGFASHIYRYINEDGTYSWIETNGRVKYDENGQAIGAICNSKNVDDKVKMEQDIKENEERYRNLLENIRDVIIETDYNGNIIYGSNSSKNLQCRDDDILARIGGDEFVILLPQTNSVEADNIVQRINKAMSAVEINHKSISIALEWETKSEVNQDINEIFKKAEDYMYRKKRSEKLNMNTEIIEDVIKWL